MRIYAGVVREVQLQGNAGRAAWIECPEAAIPAVGRYVMAWSLEDAEATLATPLFASMIEAAGFLAAAPVPAAWEPGSLLQLRGPHGSGFTPPANLRRLALASLGQDIARLQPLLLEALEQDAAVALFADHALPSLPSAVEANPLEALGEALTWADYLALDAPPQRIPDLSGLLRVERGARTLPCPAQTLVYLPMPCGGLADCGVCAVETRGGWRLACEDGPVFELIDLLVKG